ncbi:MAG TPA: lipoyl domain-containing protein [Pirellulales bacterium]|nr:lipoyl domain-containing protein [Pirellulales bacterium]
MPVERYVLTLPELGLGDRAVVASVWLVERGGEVTAGDRLLEILAGEVTIDLPAPASGLLVETLVDEDEALMVGQPLAVIEGAGDAPMDPGT